MCVPPEVICMLPQVGAVESPKNQIVIRVVYGVSDGHVTEYMTICNQDVVRPGPYLPPHPYHTSCPPIPGTGVLVRTEVSQHILQSCCCQGHHNFRVLLCSFRYRKVGVEIVGHQQFRPAGALSKSYDNALNVLGEVRGEVASNDVPLLLPHHQIETDNVGSEFLELFSRKP